MLLLLLLLLLKTTTTGSLLPALDLSPSASLSRDVGTCRHERRAQVFPFVKRAQTSAEESRGLRTGAQAGGSRVQSGTLKTGGGGGGGRSALLFLLKAASAILAVAVAHRKSSSTLSWHTGSRQWMNVHVHAAPVSLSLSLSLYCYSDGGLLRCFRDACVSLCECMCERDDVKSLVQFALLTTVSQSLCFTLSTYDECMVLTSYEDLRCEGRC